MATSSSTSTENKYDPIKMLHVYLSDNSDAPKYLSNYLINRMGDQIKWYDKRSGDFKAKWEKNRRGVIVLSAAIPFLVGLIGLELGGDSFNKLFDLCIKTLVGLSGVSIAVLEGLNSLHKSQDLYVDYRATAEQLRQEFGFFLGKSGDYEGLAGEASYAKLIANAEGIMIGQNNRWATLARKKEKEEIATEIQKAMQDFLQEYGIVPETPTPKNRSDEATPGTEVQDTPPDDTATEKPDEDLQI